jgi:hypothetical protein
MAEIGCENGSNPQKVALCTVWYHRTGDGRSSPPYISDRLKVAETVIGFARVGRVLNQWDRLWVEIESPALSQWFMTDDGRDIRCLENRCAFTVMQGGTIDPWIPGNPQTF